MLSTIETRKVSATGIGEQATFKINANGKAFKVLIDGLYSDKILAVIRELWTNAFDSHIAAGCAGRSFTCHLPTTWEPTFSVRDYGVSLSHDDVMNLYTTVFASSKDGTNTQVGKLGLGSKSPFAYVDAFTVTAWLQGEKRVYSAFIGADYVPRIALMAREDTDEDNGLEVAFPVKTGDVKAFAEAAERVAIGFDVLPGITGNTVGLQPLETVIQDLPLWRLVTGDSLPRSGAYAKQGCVVYPIDGDAIPGATELQRAVLRSPFFIDFPIGDLEITASREALGYDESTCRNILAVADVIAADVARRYQEEIDTAESYWDALMIYGRFHEVGLDSAITDQLKGDMLWRGRKLSQTFDLHGVLERGAKMGVLSGGCAATYAGNRDMNRRGRNLKWEPSTRIWNLTYGGFVVVLEDTTTKTSMPGQRLKHWYRQHGGQRGVLWLKGDPRSMSVKRVLAKLGKPEVIMLDDATMPRPPHAIKAYQKHAVPMKVLDGYGFEPTTINTADAIVYVRLERDKVENHFSVSGVLGVLNRLVAMGHLPEGTKVVGVPGTHKKLPDRNPHWRSLWDIAAKVVADGIDVNAAARSRAYKDALSDGSYTGVLELCQKMIKESEAFEHQGAGYRALTYVRVMQIMADKAGNYDAILNLARDIRQPVTLPHVAVPSFDRFQQSFVDAYPLLKELGSHDLVKHATRNAVLDYVNLIDARNGKALVSVNLQIAA